MSELTSVEQVTWPRRAVPWPEAGSPVDRLAALAGAIGLVVARVTDDGVTESGGAGLPVVAEDGLTLAAYRGATARALDAPAQRQRVELDLPELAEAFAITGLRLDVDLSVAGQLGLQWKADGPGDIAPLARLLDNALATMRSAPGETLLGAVELVDPGWSAEILALGRAERGPGTRPDTVHEAFARVATAQPDRVAIVLGEQNVSYGELHHRAERIARHLVAHGVRPGERVGTCAGRTIETVVSMLAVAKAGATYVPLDPGYPPRRLAFVVADADLRVVLTTPEFTSVVPAPVAVDVTRWQRTPPSAVDLPAAAADTTAYVIYTSGSSGQPKGVLVAHHNVTALVSATATDFGLGASDVWTWFHSEAFDFSVWEIWGCLLTGGRLVVVAPPVCRSPADFRALLAEQRVTVLNQTPSAFSQVRELECEAPAGLSVRLVILGGEPLDTTTLAPWLRVHPTRECRLVNMFGITETTVHVTAQDIGGDEVRDASKSVGRPIPGWTVRVADGRGRVLPPGVVGEIVVGGLGVADGYLARPELTAQKFVFDANERLYRSGDEGRLLPDGRLEYLGRLDSQVALRGYRVELEEVRAVLLRDAAVLDAAVVLMPGAANDPAGAYLQGFVVLAPGCRDGETTEIRSRAAEILPPHMVPAGITAVQAMPLTVNGKLDVAALASRVHAAAPAGDAATLTPTERQVLAVWTEVLGPHVDLDTNFFTSGGNSLTGARLVRSLGAQGHTVTTRQLYAHPTVRRLAGMLADPG